MDIDIYLLFRGKCLTVCLSKEKSPFETKVYFDQNLNHTADLITSIFKRVSRVYLHSGDNIKHCVVVSEDLVVANSLVLIAQDIFHPDQLFNVPQEYFASLLIEERIILDHQIEEESGYKNFLFFGALGGKTILGGKPGVIGTAFIEFGDFINVIFVGKKGFWLIRCTRRNLDYLLTIIQTTAQTVINESIRGTRYNKKSFKVPILLFDANSLHLERVTRGLENCTFTFKPQRISTSIYYGIRYAIDTGMLINALISPARSISSSIAQNPPTNLGPEPSPNPIPIPDPDPDPDPNVMDVEISDSLNQMDIAAIQILMGIREDNNE